MASKLQLTAKYDNPYEAAYNAVRGTSTFRQEDWDTFARRGQIDSYLSVLSESDKLPIDFDKKYNFDLLDTDTRFEAMANELWGDRTEVVKREESFFNEQTGKEDKRTWDATEYDYNNYLLQQKITIEQDKIIRQQNQERKDNMNDFVKAMASTFSVLVVEPVLGATEILQDLLSLAEGVYDGFDSITKGSTFGDGFREAFNTNEWGGSDWRFLDEAGFTDALLDFEKKYTGVRDLDGNYTTAGKYLGGVTYSLGKALPTIALNLASGGTLGTVSTAMYYTGMGAGEFRQMASNPEFASVPTYKLLLNASVKTVAEFLIQKGLSQAFGPTQLDKLMFGETSKAVTKVTAGAALTRIAKDFMAEGTEEFLQQYSNYLVDSFFAVSDEEFASNSDWNLQTMFDSFILGGLSTIGGNMFSVSKSIVGDIVHRADGRPSLNLLASWQYKNTLSDLSNEYNRIMKDKSLTPDGRKQAFGQMYATMRTIADVYGEIGEARFTAAQKMLEQISNRKFEVSAPEGAKFTESTQKMLEEYKRRGVKHVDTAESAREKALVLMNSLTEMKSDEKTRRTAEKDLEKAKISKKLADIKTTDRLDDVILDIDDETKDQVVNTLEKFRAKNPGKNIVLTQDGIDIVEFGDTVFIPLKYATIDDSTDVSKRLAEKKLFKEVANANILSDVLQDIKKQYELVSNETDADMEKVIEHLFFNDSFFRIVLANADKSAFQLLSHLDIIEKNVVSNTIQDGIYKRKIADAKKRMGIAISQYLILQQSADYNDLTILTKPQIDFIKKHRWGKDLSNRILEGGKLESNDITLLKARINSMPVSTEKKVDIMKGLGFNEDWEQIQSTKFTRKNSLTQINREYRNNFLAPFDGETYLTNDSPLNNIFNEFLFEQKLTLKTIKDISTVDANIKQQIIEDYGEFNETSLLNYRQQQFQDKHGGRFTFHMPNGNVIVKNLFPDDTESYKAYQARRVDIREAKDIGQERQMVNVVSGRSKLDSLINKKIDAVTRGYLTLTDAINEPELLTADIRSEIKNAYGELTPNNAFLYLRDKMLDDTGTISIVVRADGSYTFVDIRPMTEALISMSIDFESIPAEGVKIDKLIKKKFLSAGRLKDITVKVFGDSTHYDADSNTITIARTSLNKSKAYLRFALLHEFEHAIQAENNLNGGLSQDWLKTSGLSQREIRSMLDDARTNRPDLFEGIIRGALEHEIKILNQFVYDTSGESQAMGTEGSEIIDFYPTVVQHTSSGTKITMPWGTQYQLKNLVNARVGLESLSRVSDSKIIDEKEIELYKALKKILPNKNPDNAEVGMILHDGYIGFNTLFEEHMYIFSTAAEIANISDEYFEEHMAESIDIITIANNRYRYRNTKFKANADYTITIADTITDSQYHSLINFVDDILSKNETVEINAIISDGYLNAKDMLKDLFRRTQTQSLETPEQPGSKRTRVTKKKIEESPNLKPFKGKLLSTDLQNLISSADKAQLSKSVLDLMEGDLNLQTIANVIRSGEKLNDYTFQLLNKHIYKNEYITSQHQLERLVEIDAADYYAMREILKSKQASDLLIEQMTSDEFLQMIESLNENPNIKKTFDRIRLSYEEDSGKQLDINRGNLRVAFMNTFDGSIDQAGAIANMARKAAISGIGSTTDVKTTRSGISNVAKKVAAENSDVFETLLSETGRTDKELSVLQYRMEIFNTKNPNAKTADIQREVVRIKTKLEEISDSALDQYIVQHKIAEINNTPDNVTEEISNDVPTVVRRLDSIQKNIKRYASDSVKFLSEKDFKNLPDNIKNLFDDKRKLKRSVYDTRSLIDKEATEKAEGNRVVYEQIGKTREELLELEYTLHKLKNDAKTGMYRNKTVAQITKDLEKYQARYQKERSKRIVAEGKVTTKIIEKTIVLNGQDFDISSDIEMPARLREILNVTFDDFSKAETQFLTSEGDKNMKMNLKKFIEVNSERLASLSQNDVDSIIEFYESAILSGKLTRDNIRKYDAFQIYILGYLLDQGRQGQWNLTTDQIRKIESKLELMASTAGTNLAVWRATIKLVNPNKVILQSLERRSGIILRDEDLENVSKAMRSNDIKSVIAAQDEMLRNALKDNAGSKKSIWNKIWSFQRMAMLSSPGTWIRNHVSNGLVTVGNNASDFIGNLFLKKKRKSNQYKIVGTNVSTSVKSFIDENLFKNGFMDKVMDGLSKYDTRKMKSFTNGTDIAVDMLAQSVEQNVLNHRRLAKNEKLDKALKLLPDLMTRALSDDPWIKTRTKSYLGKMLTEDNVDLTKGISHQVLETLANAFTAASFDYMRKPNLFTKFEAKIKEEMGDFAYFAYKQFLPFASASWNWFAEGLRYTPIGLVKSIIDFAKLENTIDKLERKQMKGEKVTSPRMVEYLARRNIGKGIIGSIGLGIGILLGALGVATIDEEDDKLKLKCGDISVDISGIFGTQSIMLGMMITNPRKGNWEKYCIDVFEVLAHDSLMSDLFNTFRYNQSVGEMLLEQPNRSLGMMMPNFFKTFTSLLYNHQIQYSKGTLGQFERTFVQSVPGLAYLMPKKYDPYTGELQTRFKIPFVIDFINRMSPIKLYDANMSNAEKEAVEHNVKKGELTGDYDDIGTLSPKDKSKLNQKYGELNSVSLKKLQTGNEKYSVQMTDGSYKNLTYSQMSTEQKKRVTERIMSENARYAKIFIYTSNGGKYYASSSDYKALRDIGIQSNMYKETKKLKGFI